MGTEATGLLQLLRTLPGLELEACQGRRGKEKDRKVSQQPSCDLCKHRLVHADNNILQQPVFWICMQMSHCESSSKVSCGCHFPSACVQIRVHTWGSGNSGLFCQLPEKGFSEPHLTVSRPKLVFIFILACLAMLHTCIYTIQETQVYGGIPSWMCQTHPQSCVNCANSQRSSNLESYSVCFIFE